VLYPFTKGLSDHDAQIIEILIFYYNNHNKQNKFIRKIDSDTMFTFSQLLSQENWGEVFIDGDINLIFNNFLDIYLRIYNASFPINKRKEYIKSSPWITPGIKISCSTKRHL